MKIAIYCHSIAPSIDGVCRRFTGIIWELVQQGHEIVLFTLEEKPEDLPSNIVTYNLDYLFTPAYPNKKIGKPNLRSIRRIWEGLMKHRPDIVHVTCDGLSPLFILPGVILGIPIVGSFHTDVVDLFTTHNANAFQIFCAKNKERADALMLDSCATTSPSFSVRKLRYFPSYIY